MSKKNRIRVLKRLIERLEGRLISMERSSNRFSWLRLVVFFGGVAISAIFFFLGFLELFFAGLVITFLAFLLVAAIHRRMDHTIEKHKLWISIKRTHVARAQLDWSNLPPAEQGPETGIELDLDLTGEFSVHRLINTAVTSDGGRRLIEWLATTTPDPEVIRKRQQLVRELVTVPLFRDRLTLSATVASGDNRAWHSDHLLQWLKSHKLSRSIFVWMLLLASLAILNLIFLVLNLTGVAPAIWQISFLVYAILFLLRSRELGEPFHEAAALRDGLEQLSAVFRQLESFGFRQTPKLRLLCEPFSSGEGQPSKLLARLNRVVAATGIRGNPLFWLILNAIMPWDYIFAWQLDRLRSDLRKRLPEWMDIWFELEALSSLASLAYLNPHYSFPVFVQATDSEKSPIFQATELGHPLIPDDHKVCNDFAIDDLGTIVLISGSNMSGKSTFLRTVSLNLVLGQAGGPADAAYMRCRPVRLHTCIRISDSVTDGISYFYAEVKCLKALLDELDRQHPLPLFYFVDEIFQGTNNRERMVGSRAYVRALTGKLGLGMLSTHDLDLVHLSDEVQTIENVHFRDDVADGRMVFSYLVHSGPSPTTNALKIMRQEGLPV